MRDPPVPLAGSPLPVQFDGARPIAEYVLAHAMCAVASTATSTAAAEPAGKLARALPGPVNPPGRGPKNMLAETPVPLTRTLKRYLPDVIGREESMSPFPATRAVAEAPCT